MRFVIFIWTVQLLAFSGCNKTLPPPLYNTHDNDSYLINGRNRTFAAYNAEHRLLTHPIEDLLAEINHRRDTGRPITDIYVVSHGWNFTAPLAVANYHNYMQVIDDFMKESPDPDFQPYFIFVTWVSSVRPLTDISNATLPLGINYGVRWITSLIDKVPAHLLTSWKQSINTSKLALGSRSRNEYLQNIWDHDSYGYWDSNLIEDSDANMGEDIPLSALIYRLIEIKEDTFTAKKNTSQQKQEGLIHDNNSSKLELKGRRTSLPLKIHLTGHSYGSKLLTIASEEALRRWTLRQVAKQLNPERDIKCLALANYSPDIYLKSHDCTSISTLEKDKTAYTRLLDTTERKFQYWFIHDTPRGDGRLECKAVNKFLQNISHKDSTIVIDSNSKCPGLESKVNNLLDNDAEIPLESLTLFNPAFAGGEVHSFGINSFFFDTLRLIPRKSIVYTNSDYANGFIFRLRDTFLNPGIINEPDAWASDLRRISKETPDRSIYRNTILNIVMPPLLSAYGLYGLAVGGIYSLTLSAGLFIIDTPMDFIHHINNNDMDGYCKIGNPYCPTFLRAIANAIDYPLPIKPLAIKYNTANKEDVDWQLPLFTSRKEKDQGFFRLSRPGFGKTGLNDLSIGRIPFLHLGEFTDYIDHDTSRWHIMDDTKKSGASEIDAQTFCHFINLPIFYNYSASTSHSEDIERAKSRNRFYSFDASTVYDDTTLNFSGAHSDLRSINPPNHYHCDPDNNGKGKVQKSKRDLTVSFLYKFTKTNFWETLKEIERNNNK